MKMRSPDAVLVDLKFHLWTVDIGFWREYAPAGWKALRAVKYGHRERAVLQLDPGEVPRYGVVLVTRNDKGYHADVSFCSHWADVEDLAGVLGVESDDMDRVRDWLDEKVPCCERCHSGERGVTVKGEVHAHTLKGLLLRIHKVEERLARLDEECLRKLKLAALKRFPPSRSVF
jgi:hypothetical protein